MKTTALAIALGVMLTGCTSQDRTYILRPEINCGDGAPVVAGETTTPSNRKIVGGNIIHFDIMFELQAETATNATNQPEGSLQIPVKLP